MIHVMLIQRCDRRGIASTHTRRPEYPYLAIQGRLKLLRQAACPRHFASGAITHPQGKGRGRRLALPDDREMRVEGGDFVHFALGKAHPLGQGGQVIRGQVAMLILDKVQVFNQQIPPQEVGAKQFQ
jgi:hypothetical protein